MNKKYWLIWGIIFVLLMIFCWSVRYYFSGANVIGPSTPSIVLFATGLANLFLNLLVIPIGWILSFVFGYLSFVIFPIPAIIIGTVSVFLNGAFWGWIYGKIKNKK